MRIFFDTNVLVAASAEAHPHHASAFPAVERVAVGHDKGFISSHSLAEAYAALTRLPVLPRIHPTEAYRIITETLLPHFEVVELEKDDYLIALNMVRDGGWYGAKIYDALLLRCAGKCRAHRIYTFNLADFVALASSELRDKICLP